MAELGLSRLGRKDSNDLRDILCEIFARASDRSDLPRGFLGTMPMTLSRRHIQMIQGQDYVVLEKSDGMRYLMLVLNEGCLLVDRKMSFFHVSPDPHILMPSTKANLNPERQHMTLLDGELTRNLVTNEFEFLVYDLVALNGDTSIARRDYRSRLICAEDYVTYPRCFSSHATGTLRIRVKDYYEKNEMKMLFSKISKDDHGEYIYANADRKDGPICNYNDGCIFAPVKTPYQLKTFLALLKWKPPNLNSVDFQLRMELFGDEVKTYIYYQGDGGPVKLREVYFPSKQKALWARDFERTNGSIIECSYDRMAGEWRYIRTREDKDSPNYSGTVIDTLESTAEEVTRDQLIAAILKGRTAPLSKELQRSISTEHYEDDLFDSNNVRAVDLVDMEEYRSVHMRLKAATTEIPRTRRKQPSFYILEFAK